mmetsp:Transcript_25715/g.50342  ORF Transcript_25715/g.50342 Transcript_25715/m.50342 type:complete len:131 (-) Transcript_25715:1223-1615(-)
MRFSALSFSDPFKSSTSLLSSSTVAPLFRVPLIGFDSATPLESTFMNLSGEEQHNAKPKLPPLRGETEHEEELEEEAETGAGDGERREVGRGEGSSLCPCPPPVPLSRAGGVPEEPPPVPVPAERLPVSC